MSLSRHFQPSERPQGGDDRLTSTDEAIAVARSQADGYRQMVGPDGYGRLPPNLFGFLSPDDGIKRYVLNILAEPQVRTPPEEVYLLRDAYVAALPLVYTREREIFAPSLTDHHTVHPFQVFVDFAKGHVPDEDAPVIFIFKAGCQNYGHILVEMLPKLENVAPLISEPTRVLVPPLLGTMAEQLQSLISDLYPGKFIILPMRSPILRVRELLYPGPISSHNLRKSRTLLRFIDRLHGILPTSVTEQPSKRLYVSREGTTKRSMVNEAEIRACFETHGYTSVQPERLTLREQASLFAAATHVAGPLGAGLTNIAFAREKAEIVMIDNGMYGFFFWDLACLRRQHFNWHFSAPLLPFEIGKLHADYTVPVEPIRQMLKALG